MFIASNLTPVPRSPEAPGGRSDMRLLEADQWLLDTEVRYDLQYRNGLWHLNMVYIAADNPFKLIRRWIDAYVSEQKARTFARIMQRGIRKDARGTIKTNRNALRICDN